MTNAAALVPSEQALATAHSLVSLAHPRSIYLLQAGKEVLLPAMQELIDHFALQGKVRVILGANRITFDHLPLVLGEQAYKIYEIIDRISITRAEVCYQMLAALQATELNSHPLVITDMLESFYEEDLSPREVTALLEDCLERIQQISLAAPVVISANSHPERKNLIDLLADAADVRIYFQPAAEPKGSMQFSLWEL